MGPRACNFCVEIATSAPKPNCPPSVKRVEAFTYTQADPADLMNKAAFALLSVKIASE